LKTFSLLLASIQKCSTLILEWIAPGGEKGEVCEKLEIVFGMRGMHDESLFAVRDLRIHAASSPRSDRFYNIRQLLIVKIFESFSPLHRGGLFMPQNKL
jgi:hypothetical protein